MHIFCPVNGNFCYTLSIMTENSTEQQLQQLEREYRERRAAIEQSTASPEQAPETTHETVSKMTEEAIQKHVPTFQAASHSAAAVTDELSDQEKAAVQSWVNLVFSKSLADGIKAAQASGDPALLDAFHAALTGALHDQLVSSKKLEELS